MRLLNVSLMCLLALCGACHADMTKISVEGNFNYFAEGTNPWDSSISTTGMTPYTLSLIYDSNAVAQVDGETLTYPAQSFTLQFGDYNFNGSSFTLDLQQNTHITSFLTPFKAGGENVYPQFTLDFTSDYPVTLSNFASLPLSDINLAKSLLVLEPNTMTIGHGIDGALAGQPTTYSIHDLSTPEPSSWLLGLVAGGLFLFWGRRWRQVR